MGRKASFVNAVRMYTSSRLCQLKETNAERREPVPPSENAGRILGDAGEFTPCDESCRELFGVVVLSASFI